MTITYVQWSVSSELQCNYSVKTTKTHKDNSNIILQNFLFLDLRQFIPVNVNKGYSLDLLFSNLNDISVFENIDSILTSDKHHISYEINFKTKKVNSDLKFIKQNFYRANYELINFDLLQID